MNNPIPNPILFTVTPKNMGAMHAYINKFNGGEKSAAIASAFMMQNLCRKLVQDYIDEQDNLARSALGLNVRKEEE